MKILVIGLFIVVTGIGAVLWHGGKSKLTYALPLSEALAEYGEFYNNWPLITVRFRRDTGEQRFTYANELAYQTLKSGKTDYPDGAIFAKVALGTSDDPMFPSSAVPLSSKRYQLMLRDREKYKDTGGWGYILFDFQGKRMTEEANAQPKACYACHLVAESRGFVFSQFVKFEPGQIPPPPPPWAAGGVSENRFDRLLRDMLPAKVRANLPKNFTTIDALQGPLKNHLFQGTLDEVRPLLAAQSTKTNLPAILISDSGERFTVVFPETSSSCVSEGKAGVWMWALTTKTSLQMNDDLIRIKFCQAH